MSLRRRFTVAVAFGLAISACGAAVASVRPTAEITPSLYVATGGEPFQLFAAPHFPKLIWVTEQDYLSGLSWKGAGQATATATGTFHHEVCTPNCAEGPYRQYAIKLTAAHPEWCTVTLYNRQGVRSTRRAYVYDTITPRGTTGSLPYVPYFRHACS